MCTRFNGTPVIAGSNHHGVDTIHDALIMCCSPVRIARCKSPGGDDPIPYGFTLVLLKPDRKFAHRDRDASPRKPFIGQVGEDPQMDLASGDRLDQRRELLARGINGVGAHGIPDIVQQVQYQKWTDG